MKTLWFFLPILAGCLSLDQPGRNFIETCRDLQVSPDDGILSGNCDSKNQDSGIDTSVDLDRCLAWGDVVGSVTRLFPAKGGNFTDSCNSCSLIEPSQSPSQVGFILCKCGPKGSDFKLEYTFDLSGMVSVGDDGRLQCLVGKDTLLEIPLLDDNHAVVNTIPAAVDWRAWLDQFDNTTNACEESVSLPYRKKHLPMRYGDTGFEPCPNDASLCCYFPPEHEGYAMEGFRLVEVADYWYRIHFKSNPRDYEERYIHMSMIFRLCKDKARCPDGETPPAWDVPETTIIGANPASTSASSSSSRRKKTNASATSRRVVIQTQGSAPPKIVTTSLAATCPGRNPRTLALTGAISPTSASTTSNDYNRIITTVAEEEAARRISASTTSRLVTVMSNILFPTSSPTGSGCDQKPVTARVPLPSPNPAEPLIDSDRLDTETLGEIVFDVAKPISNITGIQDVNLTLSAGLACPSESGGDCELDYSLDALPSSHTINREKFDTATLATLMYDTIINTQDPHVKVILCVDLVCSAASDLCSMEHVLEAQPIKAFEISLLTSRATIDASEDEPLSVQEHPLGPFSKKTEVDIDLSKLDTSSLLHIMLGATNIEAVHHARINLRVSADCESHRGSTGCSEVVIEMSGTPLSNKTVDAPQPLLERAPQTETKTKTKATKTKTKTHVKTKTKTKKVTKTVTSSPSTATVTLTTPANGMAPNRAKLSDAIKPALPTATRDSRDAADPAATFTTAQRTVL